jgi:hypothetical protein
MRLTYRLGWHSTRSSYMVSLIPWDMMAPIWEISKKGLIIKLHSCEKTWQALSENYNSINQPSFSSSEKAQIGDHSRYNLLLNQHACSYERLFIVLHDKRMEWWTAFICKALTMEWWTAFICKALTSINFSIHTSTWWFNEIRDCIHL